MKLKNKGKVYPSPSSSSSAAASSFSGSAIKDTDGDVLSILKLLPAAILALASVLSLEDREVLAYMITRSMKTTTNPNPSFSQDSKKKSSKKLLNSGNTSAGGNSGHKGPIFDCDCFDCYTSYWFRWDSSPNRELIHQVIEAFEDHLTNGEQSRKSGRSKRKEKGRRADEKPVLALLGRKEMPEMVETLLPKVQESSVVPPDDGAASSEIPPERGNVVEAKRVKDNEDKIVPAAEEEEDNTEVLRSPPVASNHKGLVRKVLPDVMGLLNSRLWSLWGPNV